MCTSSGTKSRINLTQTPEICQGNPELSTTCTYIPPCSEADWSSTLFPSICPNSGNQTKNWTLVGTCNITAANAINHPSSEIVSCTYNPEDVACTDFTYSAWGECSQSNVKTRTVISRSPEGCVGGNADTSTTCTYDPGEIVCTNFAYSTWNPATCPISQQQTRTVISQSPSGCTGGTPITSQTCVYNSSRPPNPDNAPGAIRMFFIKIMCRFANLFDNQGYESCKLNYTA
jgi:hypothetical protein